MITIFKRNIDNVWYSVAVDEQGRIVASTFSLKNLREALNRIYEKIPFGADKTVAEGQDGLGLIEAMKDLFLGKDVVRELPISFDFCSNFRRKVYMSVMTIPKGYISTYGAIAKSVGSKSFSRAVGNAMASNPFPLFIPCHRVVSSSLHLGGYGLGTETKRMILLREGVKFEGVKVSPKSLWEPN